MNITIKIRNLKIKQKHTKHTTIYIMIQNGTKRTRKNAINGKDI